MDGRTDRLKTPFCGGYKNCITLYRCVNVMFRVPVHVEGPPSLSVVTVAAAAVVVVAAVAVVAVAVVAVAVASVVDPAYVGAFS